MTSAAQTQKAAVNEQVLTLVREASEGMSAGELVDRVSAHQTIDEEIVRAILRELLERGDVTVGPKLRLIIKS